MYFCVPSKHTQHLLTLFVFFFSSSLTPRLVGSCGQIVRTLLLFTRRWCPVSLFATFRGSSGFVLAAHILKLPTTLQRYLIPSLILLETSCIRCPGTLRLKVTNEIRIYIHQKTRTHTLSLSLSLSLSYHDFSLQEKASIFSPAEVVAKGLWWYAGHLYSIKFELRKGGKKWATSLSFFPELTISSLLMRGSSFIIFSESALPRNRYSQAL